MNAPSVGVPTHNPQVKISRSMKNGPSSLGATVDSLMGFITDKIRRGSDDDRLFLTDVYESYKIYRASEGFKGFENKKDLKKALEKRNYSVGNSKGDNNKVCIFNAKLIDE